MKKINLNEISFCRPILILLLVFYHSFIIYDDGWSEPHGFCPNTIYKWLDRLSYSFMLPLFCFISGYVWHLRHFVKGHESLKVLVVKKSRRLLIPSIIFSFLYIVLITPVEIVDIGTFFLLVKQIIAGVGHMWFLPMLFWCFIGSWFLCKVNKGKLWISVVIVLILGIFYVPNICFFQMGLTVQYIQYFFIGYFTFMYREKIIVHISKRYVVASWFIFIFVFFAMYLLRDYIIPIESIMDSPWTNYGWVMINNITWAFHSWAGIIAMMATAIWYCERHSLPMEIIKIGRYCFGIYIFQQFIIMIIFYQTFLPESTGTWLPWITFTVTLFLSILLTYLVRLTRIGREIM